jgi:hypothetical protein
MTKTKQLEIALCNLLEWAKGNRGPRDGNPYLVPEVRDALITLQSVRGQPTNKYMDAITVPPKVRKRQRRRFTVVEYSGHYSVRDTWTGNEHVMGDGVDAIQTASGKFMTPGSTHFRDTWEHILNLDPAETREAYFPDSPPIA